MISDPKQKKAVTINEEECNNILTLVKSSRINQDEAGHCGL